jgi:hypothetical protein
VHCLEQIDVIDLTRGDALIVSIDCSMNEASAVMCFEALNDALIHRLDMGSQVGFEIYDLDVPQDGGTWPEKLSWKRTIFLFCRPSSSSH